MMASRKRRFGVVEKPAEAELHPVVLKKPRIAVQGDEESVFKSKAAEYFRGKGFGHDTCKKFEEHKIQFDHLATLTPDHLTRMGISAVGTQMELMRYINLLLVSRNSQGNEKVFNDPIHGHIELHPLLITIMDTPQFQRLRYIKQLGGGYFVFPGASHNRFEHCIGVAYLAGEFVESIARRQPELNITQSDILCVKIAGLCHDLGHGPFSHLFDGQFIPRATNGGKKWKHEQGSVLMLDYLIECNNLLPELNKYGLCENDLVFIKELILNPSSPPNDQNPLSWHYEGRPVEKSFLYEIVANKRTGIDVDKWDYFARDCHCLGIPNNFDWKRYTKFARVIKVDGVYQICCRDKEVTNLYEMFHTRASLHRRAYQHKTAKIVEEMITEALLEADKFLMIPGKDNKPIRISEAINDPYAYTNLNDSIIFTILQSTDPRLKPSQDILNKLHKRQLYKCIGQTQPSADVSARNETVLRSEIFNSCTPTNLLSLDDIIVKVMTFDYGMKDKNPIDQMRFYSKHDLNKAYRVQRNQVSTMLPHNFIEKTVSVYCKKHSKECLNMAKRCFVEWCNNQPGESSGGDENQLMVGQHLTVEQGNIDIPEFTPYGTPFGTPMKFEDGSSTEKENTDSVTPPVELGSSSLVAKDTNNLADGEGSRQTAKKKLF